MSSNHYSGENELPLSFIVLASWLDNELDKEKVIYTYILYVYLQMTKLILLIIFFYNICYIYMYIIYSMYIIYTYYI